LINRIRGRDGKGVALLDMSGLALDKKTIWESEGTRIVRKYGNNAIRNKRLREL
jgi:hypothetical protein